ncbi:hypothetical protein [Beggiatoa leptomitoformis]|uniref:Glycosyltransferase RgtA/B/C/D-like domain-containing protein n=1 Tax=Beggiatoa leptomitoformis TaxID=288004 RepID=A0A2N9YGG2_9GAMM|nr:hypothetical protein [Beggiatoa leptomitoformis]ALG68113.1 hypothetical protein AL038_10845 [Beggiatoa leptomitoformis]AUI69590.1 hypothetical protein BLE401_13425 [Beggiatoa leptomitoformis]
MTTIKNDLTSVEIFAIVLTIFTARLWLIAWLGSPMPFWDEWDNQAGLVQAFAHNDLTIKSFFAPNNEHYVLWAHVLTLAIVQLTGVWNTLLEMIISACIASMTAVALFRLVQPFLTPVWQLFIFCSLAVLWSLPLGWMNTVWGFQSAWFVLFLLSIFTVNGLLVHQPFTWQWWFGAVCGFLAFFSVSSGFFMLLVIVLLKIYLAIVDKTQRRSHLLTLLISVVFILPSLIFILQIPQTELMWGKVNTLEEFMLALGKALAFPWVGRPLFSLIFYFPFCIFMVRIFWQRRVPTTLEQIILVLGGWGILQAIALAYGRGNAVPYPSARQMDIFLFGVLANILAFYSLSRVEELPTRFIFWVKSYFAVWLFLFVSGLGLLMLINFPVMERKAGYKITYEQVVKNYVLTNNLQVFQRVHSQFDIPHNDPALLMHYLDDPVFRQVLPLFSPATLSMGLTKELLNNSFMLFCSSLLLFFGVITGWGRRLVSLDK